MAVAVPLFLLAVALAAVFIVLLVVFFRRRSAVKNFGFQHMTHSELEEKDLENFLATQQGALPSTRAGVITGSKGNGGGDGNSKGSDGGGGSEEEEKFDDMDLKDANGHLV